MNSSQPKRREQCESEILAYMLIKISDSSQRFLFPWDDKPSHLENMEMLGGARRRFCQNFKTTMRSDLTFNMLNVLDQIADSFQDAVEDQGLYRFNRT